MLIPSFAGDGPVRGSELGVDWDVSFLSSLGGGGVAWVAISLPPSPAGPAPVLPRPGLRGWGAGRALSRQGVAQGAGSSRPPGGHVPIARQSPPRGREPSRGVSPRSPAIGQVGRPASGSAALYKCRAGRPPSQARRRMVDSVYRTRSLGVAAEGLPDQYADGEAARVWQLYIGDTRSRTAEYKAWLLGLLRQHGCQRVLDVACGTG